MIEVFADIWCPFAHVGLRSVARRRAERGVDLPIVVRAWPLELVNGAPLDAAKTLEHVEELRTQVAPDLFGDFDPQHFPTSTLDALALVARAQRESVALGERASFEVRVALFESGLDISDPIVLDRIATGLGLESPADEDRRSVLTDWSEGQQRGVQGSPHFFCGSLDSFCPSLDISRAPGAEHLTIAADLGRLDTFLDQCFDRTRDDR